MRPVQTRVLPAACLALGLAGAAALAAPPPAEPPGAVGRLGDAAAQARRARDPLIRHLPWLYQRGGGQARLRRAPVLPSLRFGPGTTYREALGRLFLSVALRGRLPAGARRAAPLPRGVVWSRTPDGGLRLDLRAPFAYDTGSGAVFAPSMSVRIAPGQAAPDPHQGHGWAPGSRLSVPGLPPCMVGGARADPCEPGAAGYVTEVARVPLP